MYSNKDLEQSNKEIKEEIQHLTKALIAEKDNLESFQEKLDAHAESDKKQYKRLLKLIEENAEEMKKFAPMLQAWITIINTKKGISFASAIIGGLTIIGVGIVYAKNLFFE